MTARLDRILDRWIGRLLGVSTPWQDSPENLLPGYLRESSRV